MTPETPAAGLRPFARLRSTPAVKGAEQAHVAGGTVWSPSGTAARVAVLYVTTEPRAARWLAGSLAVRLGARVLVPDSLDAAVLERHVSELRDSEPALPVAVVGEADAAAHAITAARSGASRLALLYPDPLDTLPASRTDVTGWPTTLLQASGTGDGRPATVALDRALRSCGVAVRETEYADIPDGWARRPKRVRSSRRALDDLVAFLARGIGESSTFHVIPGWELH